MPVEGDSRHDNGVYGVQVCPFGSARFFDAELFAYDQAVASGVAAEAKVVAVAAMPALGWSAVVTQPLIRRDEQMSRSLETSGVLLLIAVLATFAVGSGMAIPMTRSVNRLTDAVEEFARTGKLPEIPDKADKEGTAEIIADTARKLFL